MKRKTKLASLCPDMSCHDVTALSQIKSYNVTRTVCNSVEDELSYELVLSATEKTDWDQPGISTREFLSPPARRDRTGRTESSPSWSGPAPG